MIESSIARNSIALGLFAVLTTLIIAGTYLGTRERIVEEQRKAAERALLEIVPAARHNNSMLDDTIMVDASAARLGLAGEEQIFVARQDNEIVAVILPAIAPDGYSGEIKLIIGINRDGTVAGVRALTHRETPGLGDKVDLKKSEWVLGFNGKSLQNPKLERWGVKKDKGEFDQFTGATITPRAVTAAVKRALEYYDLHRRELLGIAEENHD
jgi:electron transport complex protein RnfG